MNVKPSPHSWMKHSFLTLGSLPVRILFLLLLTVLAIGYAISLTRVEGVSSSARTRSTD